MRFRKMFQQREAVHQDELNDSHKCEAQKFVSNEKLSQFSDADAVKAPERAQLVNDPRSMSFWLRREFPVSTALPRA